MVSAAAAREGLNASQWLLQAVTSALRAKGFAPDLAEQQFALVSPAGDLVMSPAGNPIATFRPQHDDRGEWLPIENVDSEAFDPGKHWRLKPQALRVDGDRVVRLYPVVAKSLENA